MNLPLSIYAGGPSCYIKVVLDGCSNIYLIQFAVKVFVTPLD